MEGNSVGKGFGVTIGVILALSLLGMIPICGCGGCLMVGFIAAPLNPPSAEDREWGERLQEQLRQRKAQREAERAKPVSE
ncbi:hypothetical protein [Anatilimnocola floriformis]|uniref:hypothetical protein n=1 Tax=Anatilimnocola floriformis TaxID=2948575 RepID=UPI0020C2F2D2|nr:hypothetical protein [Anatilimnocola floriformis]